MKRAGCLNGDFTRLVSRAPRAALRAGDIAKSVDRELVN